MIVKICLFGLLMLLSINVAFAQNTTCCCYSPSGQACGTGCSWKSSCYYPEIQCSSNYCPSTSSSTTTSSTTTTVSNSCGDTDGGMQPIVKGTVSGYYNGQSYSKTDFCNSTRYLTEYYCSGTNWRVWYYDCKYYGSNYYCVSGLCRSVGGGCPTLFVYDGKEYVKERKSNIHSQEGIDTIDNIILSTEPAIVNGMYLLSLKETTLPEHSYIDSVKLFVGNEEAELVSAIHSRYGDITSVLVNSDDTRTDTKVFDKIDLKFKVPELKEVNQFSFEIEGYNPTKNIDILGNWFAVKLDIANVGLIVALIAVIILVVIFIGFKLYAKKI